MITTELKQKIVSAILAGRENFSGKDVNYSRSLGINGSIYNRIKNHGDVENILSDGKWINLARKFKVSINGEDTWKTAETEVYIFITSQLESCQNSGFLGILCDDAGIGKTYAAEQYARTHKNAKYIDCSQVKSKQQLVRFISKEFGVGYNGSYNDVYEDLVFYLRSLSTDPPLIILDEAGDLSYPAFLELKALQNRTRPYCGWYMMGAEGLREKIESGRRYKKVGFEEIFDRYGHKYQKITPEGKEDRIEFYAALAAAVIKANAPEGTDIRTMLLATDSRLRRVYIEIKKQLSAI